MKKRKLIVLLILSLYCLNVQADQSYKIELIIFSQDIPTTEVFDQTESTIDWPNRLRSSSSYNKVEPQHRQLQRAYRKLARSQDYEPLVYTAWYQSVKKNRLSSAVKISNAEGSVDGFFQIQRGNLVYMIVDVEYSIGSVIYRLNEKRRFKLNEIHYLDHPKFGILARISPVGK